MAKGRRSAGAYEIALEKIKGASHMVLRPHACRDIQNDKVADTLERGASLLASQDSARRESTGTPKDLMHIFHVCLACAVGSSKVVACVCSRA